MLGLASYMIAGGIGGFLIGWNAAALIRFKGTVADVIMLCLGFWISVAAVVGVLL